MVHPGTVRRGPGCPSHEGSAFWPRLEPCSTDSRQRARSTIVAQRLPAASRARDILRVHRVHPRAARPRGRGWHRPHEPQPPHVAHRTRTADQALSGRHRARCADARHRARDRRARRRRTAPARARSSRSSSGSSSRPSGTAIVLDRDVVRARAPRSAQLVGYMPEHDALPPDISRHRPRRAPGPDVGPARDRRPRADRRSASPCRALRGAVPADRRLLDGHEAAREARPGPRPRPAAPAARRADQRPRPGRPRRDARRSSDAPAREFGIAVIVASHLLGEIERVCDFLVAIEAGRLLRAAPLATFTEQTGVLAVEVEDGRDAPRRRPHGPRSQPRHGRAVPAADGRPPADAGSCDEVDGLRVSAYDLVRDTVVDLGLPLAAPRAPPPLASRTSSARRRSTKTGDADETVAVGAHDRHRRR